MKKLTDRQLEILRSIVRYGGVDGSGSVHVATAAALERRGLVTVCGDEVEITQKGADVARLGVADPDRISSGLGMTRLEIALEVERSSLATIRARSLAQAGPTD